MTDYRRERLGELLVSAGLITADQLQEALEAQRTGGGKLGEVLVRLLFATEERIARTLAEQKGLEFVDLAQAALERDAIGRIPERVARMRRIIPLYLRHGKLVLAMADPLDIETIDDVKVRTGLQVLPVVATPSQILYAIEKYIAAPDAFGTLLSAEAKQPEPAVDVGAALRDDAPVVRMVNQIIREAVLDRASDIHLEPNERGMRVRYRVDGVLIDVVDLPRSVRAGITSRVKIMADIDIAERRVPQDGRIQMKVDAKPIDMRVATLPTPHGETVTIRLLNQGLTFVSLEDLGMTGAHLEKMAWFLSRPYGALLFAGPTGSGKSTAMYAALKRLNTAERKIITVEDPIEYRMDGLTQIAVNARVGLTFAAGLRSILRSDPDVIMIGEMRDAETAETGVRAALTGHLLLSSIHTNDAASALTRLTDMGIPPYITSASLLGVVAQRLARRLCPACKRPVEVSVDALERVGYSPEEAARVKPYGPVGCSQCFETGYRGRVGLFEILVLDEEIRRLFLREATMDQVHAAAVEAGMVTLLRDALDKVAAGVTSLDEIARVVV